MQSTIALMSSRGVKEWRKQHRGSINETVELEWQLLNWVQLEAQLSWELSQDPKSREKVGDPRFLELVMKAGQSRRKLLGLDRPTKIESQGTAEANLGRTFKTIDQMKAEIRRRMAQFEAQKRELETRHSSDLSTSLGGQNSSLPDRKNLDRRS
jgi:hypothetical protein